MKQPCEVCQKEEAVDVISSAFAAFSYSICKTCYSLGAEPYLVLVGGLVGCPPTQVENWAKPIIDISLTVAGKTHADLAADVQKLLEAYEAYARDQQNRGPVNMEF